LLARVQALKAAADPKAAEAILRINAAFPDEAVKFCDPDYINELVARISTA
jgi:DNA-binding GntR family transcriptional regulator